MQLQLIRISNLKVHTSLNQLPAFNRAVLTIGSFDGVHHGHLRIIETMKLKGAAINGETVILTFDPHPRITLQKDVSQLRLLTTLAEKTTLIEKAGIDHLVVIPFTLAFAAQQPEEYIANFLVRYFNPAAIIIGYDHRFGLNRAGSIDTLKKMMPVHGYEIVEISPQTISDIAVSSTKVRQALENGELDVACAWLGHPYPLSGTVVHGNKIGTRLGFPTANIAVHNPYKLIPAEGIYAVSTEVKGNHYKGMLYIGRRPTIAGVQNRSIEVHLFDFSGDLYGIFIRLEVHAFLREDIHFGSLEALSRQLETDRQSTLRYFEKYSNHGAG